MSEIIVCVRTTLAFSVWPREVLSCSNVTVYHAVSIFRMIERKRKPTDTEDVRVCMCMGRGMEYHNLQWEDIFWLDERSETRSEARLG